MDPRRRSTTVSTGGLPPFSAQTRLLVVAPHPDDETIATGLLIQQVRLAGGEVRILLLTGGDNNPWPQRWLERRLRVGAADRQRWGQRRLAEMREALRRLDVPAQALQPLGWPDMGVTDRLLQAGNTAVATLAAVIGDFRPSLIALPSLDDRHPDHGAAHVLIRLALAGQFDPPQLLTYLVHGHAEDSECIELRAMPGQQPTKQAALLAHRSQIALSGQRMRRLTDRPERYAIVANSGRQTLSALPWHPSAWLRPWLRLTVAGTAGAQSWRWREAPLQRDDDGHYRLLPDSVQGRPQFAKLTLDVPALWIFDHWGWCEL